MYNKKLMENPLRSKKDLQEALLELLRPLEPFMETSRYGLKFDGGGTVYDERTREVEAVLRPLWGLVPLLAGGGDYCLWDTYLDKIRKGTDPDNGSYWGEIVDKDQRMVEMAAVATGLCLSKKRLWDALKEPEQDNLYRWLAQINEYEVVPNNWLFFRVLVNVGFKKCGLSFDENQLTEDLDNLSSYYLGDGWYSDGKTDQIDYYIGFAMHFYGLVYASVAEADDRYAPHFKEWAVKFSQTFQAYFVENGAAIPYGRSMTYRFAQSAFWGALALADVEALPWGEIKYLGLQNLRHWFQQDIFTATGELTIGYYYRNLIMSEGYNAFGSPYWALKAFIVLALPDDHPFWKAPETAPKSTSHTVIPQARSIIQRNAEGTHAQLFTVGQHCGFFPANADAKYEKFVYSSHFGFSVGKGPYLLHGAFDNTLAVSEADDHYRMRCGVEAFQISEDFLYSFWKPWKDVEIKSYIVPLMPWHVRVHLIVSKRELSLVEGGFSINAEGAFEHLQTPSGTAYLREPSEISGIVNLSGPQVPEIIYPDPNTNLHFPRTALPVLRTALQPGIHLLASAVLGEAAGPVRARWQEVPTFEKSHEGFTIAYQGKTIKIMMEEIGNG